MSANKQQNPIEEIYKCSILRRHERVAGGVPKCIFVFYGNPDTELPLPLASSSEMSSEVLTRLYNAYIEDGSNSKLFENIFSKMELKNIATYDIQIYMIPFKLYSDDSIDVVKRKIMLAVKSVPDLSDYAYDEMYLFSKTPVTFDSNEVYHKITELGLTKDEHEHDKTNELDFLKTYLMGYTSSTVGRYKISQSTCSNFCASASSVRGYLAKSAASLNWVGLTKMLQTVIWFSLLDCSIKAI